jgi:hypothetical protein
MRTKEIRNMTPQAIDEVLIGTFPASDPPGWTSGIVRPAPEPHVRPDVVDVSRPPVVLGRRGVLAVVKKILAFAG